jgi:ABC-type multidrug transport system permease subunit
MVFKQFAAMFKARTMEFVRDRGTLLWNVAMPIFLVFGFAFATNGPDKLFKVGVMAPAGVKPAAALAQSGLGQLSQDEQVSLVRYDPAKIPLPAALKKLSQHQLEMLVDPSTHRYWVNPESSKSRLLLRIYSLPQTVAAQGLTPIAGNAALAGNSGDAANAANASPLSGYTQGLSGGKAVRYVDWLVPGAIGMNMLFSCLFGVGFVIVRYRKNGVLKRFKATPVSALNFVLAQGASRFVIVLITAVIVYAGTNIFLHFTMNGSYLLLVLVTALAIISMISLGLVFASRFKSEELANGLMNLATFPMLLLSGVFFSLEGAPEFLRGISWALPLTHFTDAAREIMLDGAGILTVAPHLLFLGGVSVIFLLIAARLFKWE